jgi:hypothetical protein
MAHASHRHVMLLHGLKQSRLRLRARAVDLIGHEQLSEDRAFDEPEAPPPRGPFLEHLGAHDI